MSENSSNLLELKLQNKCYIELFFIIVFICNLM